MESSHTEKRPLEDFAAPDAKRQKVEIEFDAAALPVLRKQIEYYFSDENMSHDQFFHPLVSKDPEGWLDVAHILSCRKVQQLGATQSSVVDALVESQLETKTDDAGGVWVRRTTPLPALVPRRSPRRDVKSVDIHGGGLLVRVTSVPEECSGGNVAEALNTAIGSKKVRYTSSSMVNGVAFALLKPFEGDRSKVSAISSTTLNGQSVDVSLVEDQLEAKKFFASLPPKIRQERARDMVRIKKIIGRKPIQIGGTRFDSIEHLRQCCRELLEVNVVGEPLKEAAFNVMAGVLAYHPRGAEKLANVKFMKVDVAEVKSGEKAKCFFVVREDGSQDDFSVAKCIAEISKNPPLAVDEVETTTAEETAPAAEES